MTTPLPDRGTAEYQFIKTYQSLLKHVLATALYTDHGAENVTAALKELALVLQADAERLPETAQCLLGPFTHGRSSLTGLGELFAPMFGPDDLRPAEAVFGGRFINKINDAGWFAMVRSENSDASDQAQQQTQNNGLKKKPAREAEEVPVERDENWPRYHLVVWLDRVEAVRMTAGWTDDEFRVGGNFLYTGAITHPITQAVTAREESIKAWEKDYENDADVADGQEEALPHKMVDIAIPEGDEIFVLTLTPTEEDLLSTEVAAALGKLSAGLATAGIDVLVGLAIAAGFSVAPGISALAPEAQELVNKHAVPGLSGLIQQIFGPELFEMPNVKVDTSWTPGTPVTWKSWAWFSDQRTDPHASTGAGVHEGNNIIVNEVRIEPDENRVLDTTVVDNGGIYKLDIRVEVTEV